MPEVYLAIPSGEKGEEYALPKRLSISQDPTIPQVRRRHGQYGRTGSDQSRRIFILQRVPWERERDNNEERKEI